MSPMDIDILHILQTVLPGILATFFLVLFILLDRTFPARTLRLFIYTISCAFLLLICDGIDNYCKYKLINPELRQIVGSIAFVMRPGTCVFLVSISQRSNSKNLMFIAVLFLINMIVATLNIWTNCLFTLHPDHTWSSGPVFFEPYLVVTASIVLLIISAINKARHNCAETFVALSTIIFSITANVIELLTEIRFLLPMTFIVCIIFYYLCLNVEIYRRDTLTTLYNRRSFYMDTAKACKKHKLILLSMDLNDLKKFNDLEGHSAGDTALKTSSDLMIHHFQKTAKIYRTGGDEFIAVFKNKSMDYVQKVVTAFQKDLAKTKYIVACGFAEYIPGQDTLASVMAESDARMYENKRSLKGGEEIR